jgi:hypothetical protein
MSKRQFCTNADSTQDNFNLRLAGIFFAASPTPRHDDAAGWLDYEKLTAALMFHASEHADETKSIAPTDARIGLRQKNRTVIRAPPMSDAFSRRDCLEDDMRRRFDVTYKSETGHYFCPRSSDTLRSA